MSEIHLQQPGFTCSVCGPFNKNKQRRKKPKETRDSKCIKNYIKLVLNIVWLMDILKVCLEKQLLRKYYVKSI